MTRGSIPTLTLILGLILSTTMVARAEILKIGFVDLEKVFNEYRGTKEAEEQLNAEVKVKNEEFQKRKEEIDKLQAELKEKRTVLSAEKKREKEGLVKQRIEDLQRFSEETKKALSKREAELTKKILEEIEAVIESIGKSEGYSLILRRGVSQDKIILYALGSYDLTEKVLKILNEKKR